MNPQTYKLIALLILLAAPVLTFAVQSPSLPYWGDKGLVSCTGTYYGDNGAPGPNPCLSLCDLIQTFVNIIYFGITLALFIATPVLFAWGGIMFLTSAGNPGRMGEAKKILTGTLIGVLIVLSAYLIVKMFVDFFELSDFIKGFGSSFTNC